MSEVSTERMTLVGKGRGGATRSTTWAAHGMVCCAQPLAAQAGLAILRGGGSAVDAAIATNACLGVMEPTSCGLGGDLFAIVWDPREKRLVGLNASGRAPRALHIEDVPAEPDGTIPLHSPYAWSTPGCANGWLALHGRFGRLPLAQLLEPAATYAGEGFPVSAVIADQWAFGARLHRERAGFGEVFAPGGRVPAEGQPFRNLALARSLRSLASGGAAYVKGEFGAAIVQFSRTNGGYFAQGDFADDEPTWDAPVSANYRGYDVWELPPNGQGIAALQMLNMLEVFDLRSFGRDSADFWHVMVEAKKLAYADRARYYADPSFASVPVAELISKEYGRDRARLIDIDRAAQSDPPGEPLALTHKETTYLCTADADGMMVSLIQSNYTGFGSGYAVPQLGIGLQNRGALFALDPRHANALKPGKRPFQTIIPAFATRDGEPLMAFGVMGGDMQPQGHAQVLVNLIDFDMNLQEAGDALRFRHTRSSEPTGTTMIEGGSLRLEAGVAPDIADELVRRGHVLAPGITAEFGGYQAIWREPGSGMYAGATESRKDGVAIGY
jgi:gamma-glutamyltranspeptidase / glutathione hydrolase